MSKNGSGRTPTKTGSDYDAIAEFYDRYWCRYFFPWGLAMLERTLLPAAGKGSHLLDVCCGAGVLAAELASLGYRVTGVDRSGKLLRCAQRNAPSANFVTGDARTFAFRRVFDGAFSTFDSLNHVLQLSELKSVFTNVSQCLKPGAWFVFDLNLEEAYLEDWSRSCTIVEHDHAFFVRGAYDPSTRLGHTKVTVFHQQDGWQRSDADVLQRLHDAPLVSDALRQVGFERISCLDPVTDLGLSPDFGHGRAVFTSRMPPALHA